MSQFHLPSSMSCRSTLTMRSSEGSFSGVASTDGREIIHGVGESPTASAFMEREQRKHVCGRLVEFPCAHHRCMCQQLPPYRHRILTLSHSGSGGPSPLRILPSFLPTSEHLPDSFSSSHEPALTEGEVCVHQARSVCTVCACAPPCAGEATCTCACTSTRDEIRHSFTHGAVACCSPPLFLDPTCKCSGHGKWKVKQACRLVQ